MLSYRLLARVIPAMLLGSCFFSWLLQPGGLPAGGLPEVRSSTTSLRPAVLRSSTTEAASGVDVDAPAAVEDLQRLKDEAVRNEDYTEAQRLKDLIEEQKGSSVVNPGPATIRSIQHWQNLLSATAPEELTASQGRQDAAVAEVAEVAVVPSPRPAIPLLVPTPRPTPEATPAPAPQAVTTVHVAGEPQRDCEFMYEKTTIDSGLLVDTAQPIDSAKICGRRCQGNPRCYSFAWHGYHEPDGVEDVRYSRKCFMFGDAHPKKAANNLVTAGECPDLRWSCGGDLGLAEKTLANHPALHDHLGGHEYFVRTMEVIKLFGRPLLENKNFLEIGYGLALAAVVMRGFNTTIYATEPYPVPWVPKRHGPFYDDLLKSTRDAVARGDIAEPFNVNQVADFANKCGTDPDGVHILQTTLEELDGIPDGSLDVSYSLAVLEHISKVDESFEALARKMRIGGLSCHQIDMRDHGSFDRPWEFLLDDEKFEARVNLMELGRRHPYFGNRIRLSEFTAAARNNGFQTVHLARNHVPATEEGLRYAEDSIAKLRSCKGCRYQNWTRDDLDGCTSNKMPMTGVFWCVRYLGEEPPEDDEKPPCGSDIWSRSDFAFFNEVVKKDARNGFKRIR